MEKPAFEPEDPAYPARVRASIEYGGQEKRIATMRGTVMAVDERPAVHH